MNRSIGLLESSTEQRLLVLAKSAAQLVSAEELQQFVMPEDMEKPEYSNLRERLHSFSEENNVLFTYYLRPYGDGQLQFVIDSDPDPETQVTLEDIVDTEDAPLQALGGVAATSGFGNYSVEWDNLLSAFAPVYDSNGNIYCLAGVDVSDEQILYIRNNIRILTGVQIVALIATLYSGLMGLYLYRAKAQQSEQASTAKGEFLSRMSHEIRTPMNAIIGLNRMARQSDDVDQIQSYLDNIDTSSALLLGLINDVLDLSKIESGKMSFELVAVSSRSEFENICSVVMPQIQTKRQHFTSEIDSRIPPYLFCDSIHLTQILMNLLSNAVKFTDEEGYISFKVQLLEQKENSVHLEWMVRDTGIGIDPQNLARLFDPFEQGDGGNTRKYGGTGLGLAIAKQLVEMMGGTISVQSEVGRGSVFTVTLWLECASENDIQGSNSAAASRILNLSGKQVLLVEDSEINQMIAEDMFRSMGATITLANNGMEGLNTYLANPERYDYIFMDIQMPLMDGYEATRKIRQSSTPGASDIPIIAMTANVFREDIERALEAGMNAHVGKPFEPRQVEEAILSVML